MAYTKPCSEPDHEIVDGVCQGCGREIEPECGAVCSCCEDGSCPCWEQAENEHIEVCRPIATLTPDGWACPAGHVQKTNGADVMVLAGYTPML